MLDESVVQRALARFQYCQSRMSEFIQLAKDDLRFLAGNADNGYQWPDSIRRQRQQDGRPCLTINQLPQFVRQVVNDARQARPAIKIHPVEDGDVELAQMITGLVRSIEQDSDAETAYDTALESAVSCGIGYWRILTDWTNDKKKNQKIKIQRIRNRFAVYVDPDAEDPCGADARFAFVEDWLSLESLDPSVIEKIRPFNFDGKRVQVLEYFEKDPVTCKVIWYQIIGNIIIDSRIWPGHYIPIVRVIGEEYDLGGHIIYSSLVRNAKDAQRQINYWESAATEIIALSPRAPFIGVEGQFDGHEREWANANTTNYAYLEYCPITWDGTLAPAPQRQPFPQVPNGVTQMMMTARENLRATIGLYQASLGQWGREQSGRAILARQRTGNIATFHFIDNLSRAIRHTGKILIDLIPKIYDTPRIMRILGEDGISKTIHTGRVQEKYKLKDSDWGQFDVTVAIGPAYATRREEAALEMSQLLSSNPHLWEIAGDLLVKAFDWPDADKIAARLQEARENVLQAQTLEAQKIALALTHIENSTNQTMQQG